MLSRSRLSAWLILPATLLISCSLLSGCKSEPKKYGQKLISSYDLSPAEYQKFINTEPATSNNSEISYPWQSATIEAKADEGPYTVVVTLTAEAIEDGDSSSLWTAGWSFEGVTQGKPIGLSKTGTKAGETFERTAVSAPVRFKKDQSTAANLELMRMKNMLVKGIHVDIWSGVAPTQLMDFANIFYSILLGVILIVIWSIWLRPRYASGT